MAAAMEQAVQRLREQERAMQQRAEASERLSEEIIASITEFCFEYLEAAPVRVTGHDIPYPPAKLEKFHLPDLDRILDAVDRVMDRPNSLSGAKEAQQ